MHKDGPQITWGDDNPNVRDNNEPRIAFTPDPTEEQEKAIAEWFGLSENLTGKKVLEVFSGDIKDSMVGAIKQRGGEYYSLDYGRGSGINHKNINAFEIANHYPPKSFDYIIMKYPPIWGKIVDDTIKGRLIRKKINEHTFDKPGKIVQFLADCVSLLKPQRGSFVGVACGMTSADRDLLQRELNKISSSNNWMLQSSETDQTTTTPYITRFGENFNGYGVQEVSLNVKIVHK